MTEFHHAVQCCKVSRVSYGNVLAWAQWRWRSHNIAQNDGTIESVRACHDTKVFIVGTHTRRFAHVIGQVSPLPEVGAQSLTAGGMTQAADGFLFDLANALAREVELLANLFQRQCLLVIQSEVQSDHFGLALA